MLKHSFAKLLLVAALLGGLLATAQAPVRAIPAQADLLALAAYAPEDAFAYIGFSTDDASISALDALWDRLVGKLPNVPMAPLRAAIDQALANSQLTLEKNIRPWLGNQAAIFIGNADMQLAGQANNPPIALIIEVSDRAGAETFIEEQVLRDALGTFALKSIEGEYTAYIATNPEQIDFEIYVGDTVIIIANIEGMTQATGDVNSVQKLANSARFTEAVGQLPADNYGGLAYINLNLLAQNYTLDTRAAQFLSTIVSGESSAVFGLAMQDAANGGKALLFDTVIANNASNTGTTTALDTAFLANLPADLSGVIAISNLSASIDQLLGLIDVADTASAAQTPSQRIKAGIQFLLGLNFDADIQSWMTGEAALFFRYDSANSLLMTLATGEPSQQLGFDLGLAIRATDPAKAKALADSLGKFMLGVAARDRRSFNAESTTINGAAATRITLPASNTMPAIELVLAANDTLLLLATRPIAEQILSGDLNGGLAANAGFAAASPLFVANGGQITYLGGSGFNLLRDAALLYLLPTSAGQNPREALEGGRLLVDPSFSQFESAAITAAYNIGGGAFYSQRSVIRAQISLAAQ
jgi:hypothetical protein